MGKSQNDYCEKLRRFKCRVGEWVSDGERVTDKYGNSIEMWAWFFVVTVPKSDPLWFLDYDLAFEYFGSAFLRKAKQLGDKQQ
jgi:hypothetical protein